MGRGEGRGRTQALGRSPISASQDRAITFFFFFFFLLLLLSNYIFHWPFWEKSLSPAGGEPNMG